MKATLLHLPWFLRRVLTACLLAACGLLLLPTQSRAQLPVIRFVRDPDLAPDFQLKDLAGKDLSLASARGKVILLNFWATWCGPCVSSVPELKALTKKYPSSKLVLISFSADKDEQSWRDFISKKDMEWPQYWDRDGRIRGEFGVQAFPTYLVIDPEGFIHQRIVGLNPQQSVVARLKDTLQAMFPPE